MPDKVIVWRQQLLDFIRGQYRKIHKSPFMVSLFFFLRNIYSALDDFFKKMLRKKPTLYYMELSVADHCNLNCKGCAFFSNIVNEESFYDLDQFKSDINRLTSLFGNIRTLTLLGGEPLLNKNLPQFIYESRKAFPRSRIRVVTNGLLCKNVSDELIDAFVKNDTILHITQYKPLVGSIDSLKQMLESKGVRYLVGCPVTQFFTAFRVQGDSDVKKAFSLCARKRCTYLAGGHLSICSFPILIRFFDRYFGKSLQESMVNDKIDIYDNNIDGFKIKKILSKPISACRYCSRSEFFEWEQSVSDAKVEDFCVRGAKL